MWGETKRMFFNKNFLAAWLIACISIAIGQTYPSLKKALTCGTFISILEGSLKSQAVSFAIPVAAVLPWSDSILQEYKSGFFKGDTSPERLADSISKVKFFPLWYWFYGLDVIYTNGTFLSILLCSIRWR